MSNTTMRTVLGRLLAVALLATGWLSPLAAHAQSGGDGKSVQDRQDADFKSAIEGLQAAAKPGPATIPLIDHHAYRPFWATRTDPAPASPGNRNTGTNGTARNASRRTGTWSRAA